MLDDWTTADFDPFASPAETGKPFGEKQGSNTPAVTRRRVVASRMVGVPGDEPLRTDATHPINRMFADVSQDEPTIEAEPGFEDEVCAFNLFAYLSRSDVTWNPSVVSVCEASLYCPTTEEYILPVIHGNDRVEWFVQLSDAIHWQVEDRDTGAARARVVMKAGDVAAMPGDIRHQGYSPKRSMLLVWENASPELPEMIRTGKASPAILEPVMKVEVTTPEEFMGDVIGNLNSKRGHIEGIDERGTSRVVRSLVPLAEMFGYATELRSMTQGRAVYSMEFSRYAEVPSSIANELIAKSKS